MRSSTVGPTYNSASLTLTETKSRSEGRDRGEGTLREFQLSFLSWVDAFTWLSGSCQGLAVPQSPSTKFGQNWDYSGGRKAWMTSVRPLFYRMQSPPSLCLLLSLLISPFPSFQPLNCFIPFSLSHWQSITSSFPAVTLRQKVPSAPLWEHLNEKFNCNCTSSSTVSSPSSSSSCVATNRRQKSPVHSHSQLYIFRH